ncbi:MAG: rRNA pseudouridine synthase [Planctomycetes bacterium]|nr:rRNA pseudouridine synthase [Planctomycetota bacterium]
MSPGRRLAGRVSLDRALSKLGCASRSLARAWVRAGRVSVAGRVVRDPDLEVVPGRARLAVDGRPVAAGPPMVVALHKPRGTLTTRRDPAARRTVYDLLDPSLPWLFPVGRLDRDTSGLLLFTNDTRLGEALTAPGSGVVKVYRARVRGRPGPEALARLREGIPLDGVLARALSVEVVRPGARATRLELVLDQGLNRQVRRMCAAVGHKVLDLRRTRIGPLALEGLESGAWRVLSGAEVASLTPHRPTAILPP